MTLFDDLENTGDESCRNSGGLFLKNGARYAQKVTAGFCISMAVLEAEGGGGGGDSGELVLENDSSKFILCVERKNSTGSSTCEVRKR